MTIADAMVPSTGPGSPWVTRAEDHLFAFLGALRSAGLSVPPNKQIDFLAGIEALAPSTAGQLYWVGVASLVTSEAAQATYDEVFQRYFGFTSDTLVVADEPPGEPADQEDEEEQLVSERAGDEETALAEDAGGSGLRASSAGPLAPASFARTDEQARHVMRQITDALPCAIPRTRSRRRSPGSRRGRVDLRALFLESRRTQGEIVRLRWRDRLPRERRVLLLIDVSGSMKQHSPDLLRFAHAVVSACERAEVFTFGTRLTRITQQLRVRDVDTALAALARVVLDVDGGTMIGPSLREFLANAHHVTMARGALVLVLSDGLERGDCADMIRSTHRLSQLGHQLMWWSPLACEPDYRPLTRGMSGVLDDLDGLPGVRDLETALEQVLAGFPAAQPTGGASRHV